MIEFIEWLGHAFAFYRAAQDSGMWLFQMHSEQTQNFLESSLIEQGRL